MSNQSKKLLKQQRGSVIVELSLALMILLVLMLGVLDLGQALFLRTSVAERMRGALRTGVIAYDPVQIENYVLYGTRTPAPSATPQFRLTDSMVSVTRLDTNTSADRVRITISNYPVVFLMPVLARHITLAPIVAVQAVEK